MKPNTFDETGKYEDTVRIMIHRENEIIHQRLTWCITIQGFLFAAIGFSWDKAGNQPYVLLVCIVGFLLSVISFSTMAGASLSMRRLLAWWENNKPKNYNGPGVVGLLPARWRFFSCLGPWTLMSVVFAAAWITIWLIRG